MLFDNYDNNGYDYSIFDLVNFNNKNDNNLNLFSAKEGFLRGNMFKDEYKPYKSLTYIDIKPKSDRDAKMFNVMEYSFAINDMNLYLDLNPTDKYVVSFLKELIKEEKEAKEEYERLYGPLDVCDVSSDIFDWIKDPWSWEKDNGGGMYV